MPFACAQAQPLQEPTPFACNTTFVSKSRLGVIPQPPVQARQRPMPAPTSAQHQAPTPEGPCNCLVAAPATQVSARVTREQFTHTPICPVLNQSAFVTCTADCSSGGSVPTSGVDPALHQPQRHTATDDNLTMPHFPSTTIPTHSDSYSQLEVCSRQLRCRWRVPAAVPTTRNGSQERRV